MRASNWKDRTRVDYGSTGIMRHYTLHPSPTHPHKTSAAIPFDTTAGLAALTKHGIGVI